MSPLAVVLPGRAYPASRPALATVTEVVARAGYDVRAAHWLLDRAPDDPAGYVVPRLLEVAPEGAALVIAKSLGCWASAHVSRLRLPAVWVTPVLTDPAVAAGIRSNPAPQLVAGLADPFHDAEVAAGLGCEVLELAGADHALSATGDDVIAPDILVRLADATDGLLRRLPWQG